jgi:hypothetical protein
MPNDILDILDIIQAVSRDLQRNKEFVALLRTLDDEKARKVAKSYIEFLYHALKLIFLITGRTTTGAAVAAS